MTTDEQYERAIAYARDQGTRDGTAAASWYFDGNTIISAYCAVLVGIEEGDPAVLDTFPQPGDKGGTDFDICDAYEAAFSDAVADEIARVAHYHLD